MKIKGTSEAKMRTNGDAVISSQIARIKELSEEDDGSDKPLGEFFTGLAELYEKEAAESRPTFWQRVREWLGR